MGRGRNVRPAEARAVMLAAVWIWDYTWRRGGNSIKITESF